jgi:hypothetical protein
MRMANEKVSAVSRDPDADALGRDLDLNRESDLAAQTLVENARRAPAARRHDLPPAVLDEAELEDVVIGPGERRTAHNRRQQRQDCPKSAHLPLAIIDPSDVSRGRTRRPAIETHLFVMRSHLRAASRSL